MLMGHGDGCCVSHKSSQLAAWLITKLFYRNVASSRVPWKIVFIKNVLFTPPLVAWSCSNLRICFKFIKEIADDALWCFERGKTKLMNLWWTIKNWWSINERSERLETTYWWLEVYDLWGEIEIFEKWRNCWCMMPLNSTEVEERKH